MRAHDYIADELQHERIDNKPRRYALTAFILALFIASAAFISWALYTGMQNGFGSR